MTTLIVDGSNLCLAGQKKKRGIKTLGALLPCLRALLAEDITAYVIFDASFRHRIDKRSRAAAQFEALLKRDEKFQQAPAGTPADDFILQLAALRGFGVLSNDTFSDHVTWKGRGKDKVATLNGKPVHLHSFMFIEREGFVIPSLGISHRVDGGELSLDEIIAARRPHLSSPPRAAPATAAKPKVEARPAPARAASAAQKVPKLDFLLELSPLMLRATDLFDAHQRVAGRPWNTADSTMSAEAFGRSCFARPALYKEREGRDRDDGYFCDPRYGKERHAEVRALVTERQPQMLPLIASARGRLLPLLKLLYGSEPASFTFERVCLRAKSAGLAYYERYLHSMLWALVASDGVEGADPEEDDIATILQGQMRVVPGVSQSEMLNFLQRGILYLLANEDDNLPELVLANVGWMLQLPKEERMQRAIMGGHLAWLADGEN